MQVYTGAYILGNGKKIKQFPDTLITSILRNRLVLKISTDLIFNKKIPAFSRILNFVSILGAVLVIFFRDRLEYFKRI